MKQIRKFNAVFIIILAYIRTVSFVRLTNIAKLKISYITSVCTRKPWIYGNPMALSIEPINLCNLKCPECPTGMGSLTRPKGILEGSALEAFLQNTHNSLWHLNLYFQGEPYMHPDFFSLVKRAKQRKLVVETSTNAQFLSLNQAYKTVKCGLDVIVISLDGTSQEVYEKYRVGGEFSKVISGIKNLVAAKKELKSKTPLIRAQFLVFSYNEHQINDFKDLAWQLGVNQVDIKKAQIYSVSKKRELLPKNNSLSRYKQSEDGSIKPKGKMKNKCWKHWSSSVITWNGNIVPCCFDKNAKYKMGDITKLSLNNIWKSNSYKAFRKDIITNQKYIDICTNCPISRR